MRLHYMPGSCALSCHIALEWVGAEYETNRLTIEEVHGATYKAINPKGKVPALEVDDAVLTEAAAILVHIAEAFPDAALLPEPGLQRGKLLEALSELTGEFHPAFAPIFVPDRFTIADDCHDSVGQAARRRVVEQFDAWNGRLGDRDWVLDSGKSVADAYLYVMCRWHEKAEAALDDWPALAGFARRVEKDDAVLSALSQEGLAPLNS